MWSDVYNYAWGCRCCLNGSTTVYNQFWDLYEYAPSPTQSPTTEPTTAAPSSSPTDAVLEYVGLNPNETLSHCQGDCDDVDDCEGNLICYQRDDENDTTVPGCTGLSRYSLTCFQTQCEMLGNAKIFALKNLKMLRCLQFDERTVFENIDCFIICLF